MNLLASDVVDRICQLMKKDYHALGFLPRQAIENHWDRGEIILQRDGRGIYGYLCHGVIKPGKLVTVKQAFIDTDVRRIGFGQAAFMELIYKVLQKGARGIRLRCADDLEANWFWSSVGCRKVGTLTMTHRGWRNVMSKSTWRDGRPLNVYEFNLQDTFLAPSDLGRLWLPEPRKEQTE